MKVGTCEEREHEEREKFTRKEGWRTSPPKDHDNPVLVNREVLGATADVTPTIDIPALPELAPDAGPVVADRTPLPEGFRTTLLITAYKRDEQMRSGLKSVLDQDPAGLRVEPLVLDDAAQPSTAAICSEMGVKYMATRILEPGVKPPWRTPAFAFNIGCKHTTGDAIILSCAEMFHVKHCLAGMLSILREDPLALAIPEGKDDSGNILDTLKGGRQPTNSQIDELQPLSVQLPFLMGFKRAHYEQIGGYDEDMVGMAFDDDDIVWRLLQLGCHYRQAPKSRAVHLYHDRIPYMTPNQKVMWAFNRHAYLSRRRILVRNKTGKWGQAFRPKDHFNAWNPEVV